MHNPEPTNTTRVVRDTFIDMVLYLECPFLLHSVNDSLVEDIIQCMAVGGIKRPQKEIKKFSGEGALRGQTGRRLFLSVGWK